MYKSKASYIQCGGDIQNLADLSLLICILQVAMSIPYITIQATGSTCSTLYIYFLSTCPIITYTTVGFVSFIDVGVVFALLSLLWMMLKTLEDQLDVAFAKLRVMFFNACEPMNHLNHCFSKISPILETGFFFFFFFLKSGQTHRQGMIAQKLQFLYVAQNLKTQPKSSGSAQHLLKRGTKCQLPTTATDKTTSTSNFKLKKQINKKRYSKNKKK